MNKKSQTKFMIFLAMFLLIFGIGAFVVGDTQGETGTVSIDVSPLPGGGWQTVDDLYVNVTPQITYDFGRCYGGWGNSSSFDLNVSYTWGFGNVTSEYFENHTLNYLAIPNGTSVQFNFSDINDQGQFSYYFTAYNLSSGTTGDFNYANCSNISVTSDTYNFWVDTIYPKINLSLPTHYSSTGGNYTSNSVLFNFTVIETNPDYCYLYTNESGSFILNHTWAYTNNTLEEVTVSNFPDGYITYFINCTDDAGNVNYSMDNTLGTNRTFFVDATAPTITEITSNNSWSTTTTVLIKVNVTESFLGSCALWLNSTAGEQGNLPINQTNSSFTSGEYVSFSFNIADTNWPNSTEYRPYYYTITCNDSSGNWATNLSGRAINVDTTIPGSIYTLLLRERTSTDHTPMINFTMPVENNFLAYILNFYTTSGTWVAQTNGTNNMTDYIVLDSYLSIDTNYTYNITVIDRAGNINTTESNNVSWSYHTDSTCWNLSEGYNFCGIIRDGLHNLTTIADESEAQYVYRWNGSWTTYTRGSSTNADIQLQRGEVAVLYMNSSAPYEWEARYWSWNTTMTGSVLSELNLTNVTSAPDGSGYYLLSIAQNTTGVNFTELEYSFQDTTQGFLGGDSIQYMSYINNSNLGNAEVNQQYYPFRHGKDFNEDISIDFGEAFWIYNVNYTSTITHVNWTRAIGGAG